MASSESKRTVLELAAERMRRTAANVAVDELGSSPEQLSAARKAIEQAIDTAVGKASQRMTNDLERLQAQTQKDVLQALKSLQSQLTTQAVAANESHAAIDEHFGAITTVCETLKESQRRIQNSLRAILWFFSGLSLSASFTLGLLFAEPTKDWLERHNILHKLQDMFEATIVSMNPDEPAVN